MYNSIFRFVHNRMRRYDRRMSERTSACRSIDWSTVLSLFLVAIYCDDAILYSQLTLQTTNNRQPQRNRQENIVNKCCFSLLSTSTSSPCSRCLYKTIECNRSSSGSENGIWNLPRLLLEMSIMIKRNGVWFFDFNLVCVCRAINGTPQSMVFPHSRKMYSEYDRL